MADMEQYHLRLDGLIKLVLLDQAEFFGLSKNLIEDGALTLGAFEIAVAHMADAGVGQGLNPVELLGADAADKA